MDRIHADVRSEQQAAVLAAASGAEPEWPTIDARIEAFDAGLIAEPEHVNPEELELRKVLGLR